MRSYIAKKKKEGGRRKEGGEDRGGRRVKANNLISIQCRYLAPRESSCPYVGIMWTVCWKKVPVGDFSGHQLG